MELQKIYNNSKIIQAFGESRIGGRQENQDNYDWRDTGDGYLVVVCDGMGGGPGGRTASSIAVNEIISGILNANKKEEELTNIIIKAIRQANMAVIQAGKENKNLRGMGSTATVLYINDNAAYVAHVGDSRVYQIRNGRKVFRTFDHSMVFEMVEQGVITEEQARLSAQSNIITRALGVQPDVKVDTAVVPYLKGDRFMLCTDGIHGTMPETELIELVSDKNKPLGTVTDNIATSVDGAGRTAGGGHDNLTLAIVETMQNSKLKPQMTRQNKLIFLTLGLLLALSVALNIFQGYGRRNFTSDVSGQKEYLLLKDTVALQRDSMIRLNGKLDAIRIQAVKINANNREEIDSIVKILNY